MRRTPGRVRSFRNRDGGQVMRMERCLQAACPQPAIAEWWLLCAHHTLVLESASEPWPQALTDQGRAAGWDATGWAERIAPERWGHAVEHDAWVQGLRALSLAAAVTRRAVPCEHAAGRDAAVPLVVLARAPLVAECATCAEPTVARTTTRGHACDRCGAVAVDDGDRVALLVGQSLILVGQLCEECTAATLQSFRLRIDGL